MFGSISRLRKDELIVLIVGVGLSLAVFYYINNIFTGSGMIFWALVETGVMWVIIIALLMLADNQRVLNEELKQISNEQLQEIKLLKEIANDAVMMIKGRR